MVDSLYVKANGEFPCWDDVGEDRILRVFDEANLRCEGEPPLLDMPELVELRRAFLAGHSPHPDLCSRCAVHGHGIAKSLHPKSLRVLHIEPAYLCQLACPLCLVPKQRLKLKGPPYYMALSYYEALLERLLRDGVETIGLIHFEGRGDPLLNRHLGDMVRLSRRLFPTAYLKITTHGNYPFAPWMLDSGLDLLRLSVDGAFEESYQRYRVGGTLQATLDLMAAIRDHREQIPSRLRVEWKYILFEWNDSDEEIRQAARLADEHEVDLRFCLTHSPGRSERYPDLETLRGALETLAPRATRSVTFQLKGDEDARIDHMVADHTEALLLAALEDFRGGRHDTGRAKLIEALTIDPGLSAKSLESAGRNPVPNHLDRILDDSMAPGTVSALANIQVALGETVAAERLFREYLARAPDGVDAERIRQVVIELSVGNRLGCGLDQAEEREMEVDRVVFAERAVLEVDPGFGEVELETAGEDSVALFFDRILDGVGHPSSLTTLARLRGLRGDFDSAERLLARALERATLEQALEIRARRERLRRARRRRRRSWPIPVRRAGRLARRMLEPWLGEG